MPPFNLPSLNSQPVATGNWDFDNSESMPSAIVSGTAAALTANQAYVAKVRFSKPLRLTGVKYGVASASGNVDVGLYTLNANGTDLDRQASSGSTAVAGTNAIQTVNFTSAVNVIPGRDYWLAIAIDNAVATVSRGAINSIITLDEIRYGVKATSFPLPSSIAAPTAASTAVWMKTVGS